MKKIITLILIILLFLLTGCKSKINKINKMFETFPCNENFIAVTGYELIVCGKRYDRNEIKYEDRKVAIEQTQSDGFYGYTYDKKTQIIKLLYVYYENLEMKLIATKTLPEYDLIGSGFVENKYYFYYNKVVEEENSWHYDRYLFKVDAISLEEEIELLPEEWELESYRTSEYKYEYHYSSFSYDTLDVTNKDGITKRIDKKILRNLNEAKQLKKHYLRTMYDFVSWFDKDGDIYIGSLYVNSFEGPCYYIILKWNFDTEECEFYSYLYFDKYPLAIGNFYML